MTIWLLNALALAIAACLLTLGCGNKGKDAAEPEAVTPVEIATARSGDIHRLVSAEAVLFPLTQASIVPKISAPVRRFLVQRGDHVKRGQLLAVLEDSDLLATTQESRELYRQAQANFDNTRNAAMPDELTKAKSDLAAGQQGLEAAGKVYESRLSLFREGALAQKLVDDAKVALVQAQSQYDTAKQHLSSLETSGQASQLKSSEAQVKAAQAHYDNSAAQSSYAEVRSPIAGVIADRGVNVGDVASSGTALFNIVDISRVVARANVPVNQASALRRGQAAIIKGPTGDVPAKVTVVSPAVDANTTTVQVWVEANNSNEELKLGSTVTISVDAGTLSNSTIVPVSALLASDEGGERVMVVNAGNTAEDRKVEVGVRDGDDVQILSGVKPGERVIVKGGLGLDDKAKVAESSK